MNSTDIQRGARDGTLNKINLSPFDREKLMTAAAEFRSAHDAWATRWNLLAQHGGSTFDPALLLQQHDDLIQATRANLKRLLSAVGLLRFDAYVQGEKRSIKLQTGEGQ
jgi:hypothetical protein